MGYPLAILLPMLLLLLWAAIADVRCRRIPNWLTLSVMVTGLLQGFSPHPLASPLDSLYGLLAGMALPFLLFAVGALGAGDVKLLAGVGAWLGPAPVLEVFLAAAIIGLIIVLAQALLQRRLSLLLRNSAMVGINLVHLQQVGVDHVAHTGQSCRSVDRPLPYAVPVLFGVLFVVLTPWMPLRWIP